MDNVTDMGKSSARGSFKMFLGVSISSVITAVSVIIIMNLLNTSGDFGLISIAMLFPTMLTLFKDWGVNTAMVKFIAQYRSENNTGGVKNILLGGLVFELLTGTLLTLICYFFAGYMASSIFEVPEARILIEFASLTIIADSFVKVSLSTFNGFERLEFYSFTQILNSVIRCSLGPLFVLLGYGVLGAIQGQIAGQLVSGLVGLLIYYFIFYRPTAQKVKVKLDIFETMKTMLKYSAPLSVSVIANGFLPQYYGTLLNRSVVLATETAYTTAMGNYSAAVNFSVVLTFFTVPLTTVLFPTFSKLKAGSDKKILQVVFQSSVKYGALLAIPVTVMVMVLSEPLVFALVTTKYPDAPFYLTLYSIIFLYTGLGNLSLSTFLQGQGRTDISMKMAIFTLIMGVLLSFVLILPFGVVGLLITNALCGIPSMFFGLWWVKKHFGVTVDWVASAKIFLASCVAAVVSYLVLGQFTGSYWVELIVGGVCFLGVYLLTAPLIRAVDKKDVNSLRNMLSGLGPFSYIFNIPLYIMEKLSEVL